MTETTTVDAPWAEDTRAGLARFLTERWATPTTVVLDDVASAGARRRNLLFRAEHNGHEDRLVATIVPLAAMQVQDFLVEPNAIALAERYGMPVAHLVGRHGRPGLRRRPVLRDPAGRRRDGAAPGPAPGRGAKASGLG